MICSSQQDPKKNHDHMTLRELFEKYYLSPDLKRRTVEAYCGTFKHWEKLTDNPPLSEIDNVTLHTFKNAYLEYNSPTTFNKERRHLLAILNRLSPPGRNNPEGLGLIDRFIYIRKLKEPEKIVRVATEKQLNAIYEACAEATWPDFEFGAASWWRSLVVFLYNTGLRRNDFLALTTKEVDLEKSLIEFSAEKTGKERRLPLHQSVVDHFASIWSSREFVFPKPHGLKTLYQQWYAIQKAAEIAQDDHLTFHQLRSTCGTHLFQRSPGAAQEMLGHSSMETTRKSYAFLTDHLVEMAQTTQQPQSFVSGSEDDPDPNIIKFPA